MSHKLNHQTESTIVPRNALPGPVDLQRVHTELDALLRGDLRIPFVPTDAINKSREKKAHPLEVENKRLRDIIVKYAKDLHRQRELNVELTVAHQQQTDQRARALTEKAKAYLVRRGVLVNKQARNIGKTWAAKNLSALDNIERADIEALSENVIRANPGLIKVTLLAVVDERDELARRAVAVVKAFKGAIQ